MSNIYEAVLRAAHKAKEAAQNTMWADYVTRRKDELLAQLCRVVDLEPGEVRTPEQRRAWAEMKRQTGGYGLSGGMA